MLLAIHITMLAALFAFLLLERAERRIVKERERYDGLCRVLNKYKISLRASQFRRDQAAKRIRELEDMLRTLKLFQVLRDSEEKK